MTSKVEIRFQSHNQSSCAASIQFCRTSSRLRWQHSSNNRALRPLTPLRVFCPSDPYPRLITTCCCTFAIIPHTRSVPHGNRPNWVSIQGVIVQAVMAGFVLTAVVLRIQVFWHATPCRGMSDSRRFEGTWCLHIYPTIQHHVQKDPNHDLVPILTPCS